MLCKPFGISLDTTSLPILSIFLPSLHRFKSSLSLPSSSNCQSGIFPGLVFVDGVELDFGRDIGVIVGLSGNLALVKIQKQYFRFRH